MTDIDHGTYAGYQQCRKAGQPCASCRAANAEYARERRKRPDEELWQYRARRMCGRWCELTVEQIDEAERMAKAGESRAAVARAWRMRPSAVSKGLIRAERIDIDERLRANNVRASVRSQGLAS